MKFIPLGIHGDGVPFAAKMRGSLECMSFNKLTEVHGVRLLFTTFPKSRSAGEKTWDAYKANFFGSLYGPDNLAGISTTAPNVVRILHISLFSIVVVLALIQFSLAILDDVSQRKKKVKIAVIVLLSAIAYQIFLLFLYMFFFGEYEGVRVAALVRYSVSFLLGWTIFDLVLIKRLHILLSFFTFKFGF